MDLRLNGCVGLAALGVVLVGGSGAARAQMAMDTAAAKAITATSMSAPSMPAPSMPGAMSMSATTLTQAIVQHGSSGTSIEPASTAVPMMMFAPRGGWQFMLHANAFAANTQQTSETRPGETERARDAFFSTNWIMPMAQRGFGPMRRDGAGPSRGTLTLRAMFSFEPATIGNRNYPLLFQQGETAYGAPIEDGQHPHDFFMEVAAMYDLALSKHMLLSFYAAPVGDPALGPTAYPHRASAAEDPVAALGHHQEDSTHVAFDVVTGGLSYRWVRAEFSGFHGAEPDEAHWHFQPSPNGLAIDSYSTRITVSPTADTTAQYSYGHIHSPEALYPGEDQQRQTASVMYHHSYARALPFRLHRAKPKPAAADSEDTPKSPPPPAPMQMAAAKPRESMMHRVPEPRNELSTTVLWGRTKSLTDQSKENSYLAEVLYRFARSNYVWTRLENAGRSNELELTPGVPLPANFDELPDGEVGAFTFGYDHDIRVGRHVLAAPGGQITLYRVPPALRAGYGDMPVGGVMFIRFRLR
jgi:hypothetical protein